MSKSKLNDKVLVVDVEATCWDGTPPQGQQSEIIEIGLVTLDRQTHEVDNKTSILIKPQYSEVSKFCTDLTTITPQMVSNGVSYADACATLRSTFKSHKRLWVSWGEYDRTMFQRMSKLHNVKYPFGNRHINVKTMYALIRNLPKDIGTASALEQEGLPLVGTHHRGADDAYNIAQVLKKIL